MDALRIHKIHVINKYRKQQFINSLVLYALSAMSCSLLVFSPFWYPPLRATVNVFLSVSLSKILSLFFSAKVVFIVGNLIVIFLVGEFKIYTVPGAFEARGARDHVLQSFNKEKGNAEIYLEEKEKHHKTNLKRHRSAKSTTQIMVYSCEPQNGEALHVEAHNYQMISVGFKPTGPNNVTLTHEETTFYKEGCSEEKDCRVKDLNKMADDFIARVNRQRRLEAKLYGIYE